MKPIFHFLCSLALLPVSFGAFANNEIDPDKLQASIQRVVEKVAPATVAVSDGRGTFSAVIVSEQGHVLSAGHAVSPNSSYRIILPDGREFDAKGLGSEPHIDMGLIKITAPKDLPVAEMGWSSTLKRNQPCISLGHPGHLNPDRGVVVRFGRIADPVSESGMIQSTCLMEPGDSGGPLFDMQGRVIGIHSNIRASLDRNYEVPVDQFRRYWAHLTQAKRFRDHSVEIGPDFGFELSSAGSRRYSRGGRPLSTVAEVVQGSLAEESGLQVGDRILEINGESARHVREAMVLLQRAYTTKHPDVDLKIKRDDTEISLKVQLPRNSMAYYAWNNVANIVEAAPGIKPVAPVSGLTKLIEPFAKTEAQLDAAVVKISSSLNGSTKDALATLIAPGNLLIAKSSLIGDLPRVSREGEIFPVDIVARDKSRDLVLLKLSKRLKGGVKLQVRHIERAPLGQFLLSPHPDTQGRVGVWSTETFAAEKRDSAGYLGVSPGMREGKVVLNRVWPNTPAAEKFEQGDFLLEVNGVPVTSPQGLIDELRNYEPGDQVALSALRNGKPMAVDLVLGVKPDMGRHIAEDFEGGKSIRRDGFPVVFSHDIRLRPEECGGPLFSTEGEFVGVNIARFSRVRSYAVPAAEVVQFVKESLAD